MSKQSSVANSPEVVNAPAQQALNTMLPDMLQSMAQVQGAAISACMKCNLELLEFVKTRCEEDMKLASSLSASHDATELLENCSEFWQRAIADYSSEVGKLAALNTELAGDLAKKTGAAAQSVVETHPATLGMHATRPQAA